MQSPEEQNGPIAWKIFIGFGVFLLLLVALVFGFKKFLEYSGAREWEMTRAMLISEGVELDLEKLLPENPPDEENFAATPLIAALAWNYPNIDEKRNLNDRFRGMLIPPRTSVDFRYRRSGLPDFRSQRLADFEEISLALAEAGEIPQRDSSIPEQAIRDWLEQFRPAIDELDEASIRPFAVWAEPPLIDLFSYQQEQDDFHEDLMVHHRFQAVRALVAATAGDEREALSALRTMFQISRTLSSQPSLIQQLKSFHCDELALSVIWEGIRKRKWSGDGLAEISDFLVKYPADSLGNLEKTMTVELISKGIRFCEHMETLPHPERHQIAAETQLMDGSNQVPYLAAFAVSPQGFLDHNKSFACRFHYEVGIRPVRLLDMHSARMTDETALHDISLSNYFSRHLTSAYSDIINRFFQQVVIVGMGRTAVAVERFREENGSYPRSLNELVPRYLSKVPMDLHAEEKGETLRYRFEKDRPLIYSVGQNQSDEGGAIVRRERTDDKKADLKKGDWVWGYSQPSPANNSDP